MIRILCGFAFLILSAAAWAQAPVVRTSLRPSDDIVIGQPVRLNVEVLFPGEMPRPPMVKLGDAPGAQIIRFETQATTMRDSIEGQDYVGQSFEFVVFPRRGGMIDLPAAQVTLLDRAGDPTGSIQGQPVRFTARVPPGIDPSGPVLAASGVGVRQSWSPDSAAAFKVGSAIVRTIERRAEGVPALGMAEFRFVAPEGVRVYVDPPMIDDKINRGSVEGVRTDRATYVFEKPGTYALPELSQPWWDLDGKRVRSESLAGASITVQAAGSAGGGERGSEGSRRRFLLVLAAVVAFLAVVSPFALRAIREIRRRYMGSAAQAARALRQAAESGDVAATYRALETWLLRLPPEARSGIEQDARFRRSRGRLDAALFGRGDAWTPQDVADLVELSAQRPKSLPRGASAPSLPPLNPAHAEDRRAAPARG